MKKINDPNIQNFLLYRSWGVSIKWDLDTLLLWREATNAEFVTTVFAWSDAAGQLLFIESRNLRAIYHVNYIARRLDQPPWRAGLNHTILAIWTAKVRYGLGLG